MRFQTSEGCRRRGLTQPLSLDRAYDVEELRARVLHVIFPFNNKANNESFCFVIFSKDLFFASVFFFHSKFS